MNTIKTIFHSFVNRAVLAVLSVLFLGATALFAQTADVRYAGVFYKDNPTSVKQMYCEWDTDQTGIDAAGASTSTAQRSFVTNKAPNSAMAGNDPDTNKVQDPWVGSALIEYDQPYPSDKPSDNKYPNHCLALCMNVFCSNKPNGGSTYSLAFPLQQIKFDIVKYYNNKNVEDPEQSPAIRTIDLYPNQEAAKCGSYRCPGAANSGNTCNSAQYYKIGSDSTCYKFADGTVSSSCDSCPDGVCNYAIFNNDGTPSNGNASIPFCAAWDGSYEISGEFGKTNGDFAFRATVATDVPGDQIITDKIAFNSSIAYPGMNQIPIQVDVTNIHMVRSTPSVVGNITSVSAQPYTYSYRLSKDADVRIAIFDASTGDDAAYAGSQVSTTTAIGSATNANPLIVRTLVDWQPRLGEGMKGQEKDVQITEFDSWDGRGDNGLLLPAGNYVVSLQAKSADEWPGIDFSRAVTRQLSLDPLKLTDVVTMGLNKKSTAYATIAYTPTESSKVYWEIYTPGTSFNNVLTDSSAQTGTGPTPTGGTLVYRAIENRTGRMNFTSKWDGLCGVDSSTLQPYVIANGATYPDGAKKADGTDLTGTCNMADGCVYYKTNPAGGCTRTYAKGEKLSTGAICDQGAGCTEQFAYGAPMPDGNYVYVLWAEIPYNGKYLNAVGASDSKPGFKPNQVCSGAKEINNQCFTGVKTLKYNTGIVSVDRGVVDITIQPVSYATVGSSPTAYGLDPFIFKYSIVRDATAIAKVENTAGVVVKYLTPEEGVAQVAQQMNTLSWDGRDDAGRMVTPGTYMFVVETKDAMFPAVTNRAAAVFPVDMYRVVDVSTTDVYGDSEARATVSYYLSKAMNVQVNIYNKDVVIPSYNNTTGDYNGATVWSTSTATGTKTANTIKNTVVTMSSGPNYTIPDDIPTQVGAWTKYVKSGDNNYRYTITVTYNPDYNSEQYGGSDANQYLITVLKEELNITDSNTAAWPPRVCDYTSDKAFMKAADGTTACTADSGCHVDPATKPTCIYVNDTNFTNYPTAAQAASGVIDVRLQPIETFERSALKPGDGLQIMEEWDALYFYNPKNCPTGSTNKKNCAYEMVPDGQYPFFISARSNEPFNRYYYDANFDGTSYTGKSGSTYTITGQPFKYSSDVVQANYLYATDKVTSKINVTRGAVYFLDGSTTVYPNAPQLFNLSSGPVFVPPYQINFAVSRAATVEIAIVALENNVCNPDPTMHRDVKNNRAGDVCKFLSTMTIVNTGHFDPNVIRTTYWDGTDNNGYYVKPGIYEVRLTAKNYPNADLYEETVKSITVNADLLKVFDLLEVDNYSISQRGTDMHISYQISVPMKVAIQIFKPGTTIFDYSKGTLRNPTTGQEVKGIHEVLVKAITGIRPSTTLIDEVWDGRDYAQQEVPDGTYPFRFVTALNGADIDSVTGEITGTWADTDGNDDATKWKINRVADTYEYQNLHKATVAVGDGRFVCSDWEKTVFFYPNPLKVASKGTLEITKMPVPGTVSIKFYNLAGDLVRDSDYTCVDANNYQVTMGKDLYFQPDNDPSGSVKMTEADLANFENIRNAALRCRWDRTNQHGKKVARGVYFGLVDFKAQNGREHCQKVVKVLVP